MPPCSTDQLELLNTQIRAITKGIRELVVQHPDAAIFPGFPWDDRVDAGSPSSAGGQVGFGGLIAIPHAGIGE